MYPLRPLKVFALDRVDENPAWVARMHRMLDAIAYPREDVVRITEQNLPEVVAELQSLWPPATHPREVPPTFMRPLIFTTIDLNEEREDLTPLVERCGENAERHVHDIYGYLQCVKPTHVRESDQEKDMVCWPTMDFGIMHGCPHGCLYCGEGHFGRAITVCVNLEEFAEQIVGPTVEKNPWQKCFRMIGWGADPVAFEPEYGVFDVFTRKLAEYEGRYGYFHTASPNVEWIKDLPHRDRLIGVWSVTGEEVARTIENGAGSSADRFEAGRKCQEMGVPVRYKFKPIIPIPNWREDYAAAIQKAFEVSSPESIGMCVIMWMKYEDLLKFIEPELLDPELLAAAKGAADRMADVRTGPFPPEVRADIYRFFIREIRKHDKKIPLYISTESREMWDELAGELGQDPRAYVCGCSSVAVPGRKLALCKELKCSTYSPTPS